MAGSGFIPSTMYGLSYNQATLVAGMSVGMCDLIYDFNNGGYKEIMFVQAGPGIGASLKANAATKMITGGATVAGVVDMVAAAGDFCSAVNDVSSGTIETGAIVVAGNYHWETVRGLIKPLEDAATAAGPLQTGSATSGQLQAWATSAGATFQQTNLRSLAASGAGGATLGWKE